VASGRAQEVDDESNASRAGKAKGESSQTHWLSVSGSSVTVHRKVAVASDETKRSRHSAGGTAPLRLCGCHAACRRRKWSASGALAHGRSSAAGAREADGQLLGRFVACEVEVVVFLGARIDQDVQAAVADVDQHQAVDLGPTGVGDGGQAIGQLVPLQVFLEICTSLARARRPSRCASNRGRPAGSGP
jgi:hypothetical protein